mmetsp:Transcript_9131/g.21316  ORF Transcript_9131/g.21316 Transcript_9131/m.21316 type:complete len:87 (+) Transcript_9131:505-765(+)
MPHFCQGLSCGSADRHRAQSRQTSKDLQFSPNVQWCKVQRRGIKILQVQRGVAPALTNFGSFTSYCTLGSTEWCRRVCLYVASPLC